MLKEELGYGGFNTVYKAVDISISDVYIVKKFYHGNWKKEVDILINFLYMSEIINLIINSYLTFFVKKYIIKFVKFLKE